MGAFDGIKPKPTQTVFGSQPAAPQMAIEVSPLLVGVSRAINDADGAQPTYLDFVDEPRLQALPIFQGSSSAGPTYARLLAATGEPVSRQIEVEGSPMLLPGDRVVVGMNIKGEKVWMFGGYFTSAQLVIDKDSETLEYRLTGPEWPWGTNGPRGGADRVCFGQYRRSGSEDDKYVLATSTVTPLKGLVQSTGDRCVFNPAGRANMSTTDVNLIDADKEAGIEAVTGRCWESPERKIAGNDAAAKWDKLNAAKALFYFFNDETRTGITCDWEAAKAVIGVSAELKSVDVDGMGLWSALAAVVGPDVGFYVDCQPTDVQGNTMKGFALEFFDRTTGASAKLTLDQRGTSILDARPNVTRVQATKDVSKCVNEATLVGRGVRHLRLKYWGAATKDQTAEKKATLLQHGWSKADGDLQKFSKQGVLSAETVSAGNEADRQEWSKRYVATGPDFAQYRHVFRLFTWNEAAELSGAGPSYGVKKNGTTFGEDLSWYAPDLNGIADAKGFADEVDYKLDQWSRRRRKLLDTAYIDSKLDGFRRVTPALFIAAVAAADDTEPAVTKYVRVPSDKYHLDPERASIWITEADLLKWRPMKNAPRADADPPPDDRNFAELLFTGKLRLIMDCSIECDGAMTRSVKRKIVSGAPQTRTTVVRGEADYTRSLDYTANGVTSPIQLSPAAINEQAKADAFLDLLQKAGQDELVHASVQIEADSDRPKIGTIIDTIAGRSISLVSKAGRGALIVAFVCDPTAMKYEALTESAAAEVRSLDKQRLVDREERRRLRKQELKGAR